MVRRITAVDTLQMASDLGELTTQDKEGKPAPNLDTYYYDSKTGMLFFYDTQREPNAIAPSPFGSCTGGSGDDPSCPDVKHGESYWACPAPGCTVYTVNLTDSTYDPGASHCCLQPDNSGECPPEGTYDTAAYAQDPPADQDQSYLLGIDPPIKVKAYLALGLAGEPFYQPDPSTAPNCGTTQP